jgi:hypothetical protein
MLGSQMSHDAAFLSDYLLGETIDSAQVQLYEKAETLYLKNQSPLEERLWQFARRSKFNLYLVDSALSCLNSHHPIRQRLIFMLGILEATPRFSSYFLPRKISLADVVLIPLGAAKHAVAILFGIPLVLGFQVIWR